MEVTRGAKTWHDEIRAFKRHLLRATLTRFNGNRSRAAKALGLERPSVCRLVRTLKPDVPAPAPGRAGYWQEDGKTAQAQHQAVKDTFRGMEGH